MRKVSTILILFVFSITHTELGQLIKLPLLINHYYVHRQQSSTLSLVEFLKDHYTKEHKDQDEAQDRQLPFKTAIASPLYSSFIPALNLELLPSLQELRCPCLGAYIPFPLHQLQFSIFHPPPVRIKYFLSIP